MLSSHYTYLSNTHVRTIVNGIAFYLRFKVDENRIGALRILSKFGTTGVAGVYKAWWRGGGEEVG